MSQLKRDHYAEQALDLMNNTHESLFLTGKAGTGKTTLIKHFINTTHKKLLLLAPTGVAAINLEGSTLHSFFLFHPGITVDEAEFEHSIPKSRVKLLQNIDTIVIDEISMVRADLLDCVDILLKKALDPDLPFGGKQVIFVGDLYQLPPIVRTEEEAYFDDHYASPYFFSSFAYEDAAPKVIELQRIYRQDDQDFKNILNKIRLGLGTLKDLEILNQRVGQEIPEGTKYLSLVTTNADAARINKNNLEAIDAESYTCHAIVEGEVAKSYYANDVLIEFKVGSQIMMIKNDKFWKNGTICTLVAYDEENETATISVDGEEYDVGRETRTVRKPTYIRETRSIVNEEIGSFSQMPFKLAWAITIHKSQGLTFDHLHIDFGRRVFAGGQAYVALSRVTSLEGLYLQRPLRKDDIHLDQKIRSYMGEALAAQKRSIIEARMEDGKPLHFQYVDIFGLVKAHEVKVSKLDYFEFGETEFYGIQGYCMAAQKEKVFDIAKMFDLV